MPIDAIFACQSRDRLPGRELPTKLQSARARVGIFSDGLWGPGFCHGETLKKSGDRPACAGDWCPVFLGLLARPDAPGGHQAWAPGLGFFSLCRLIRFRVRVSYERLTPVRSCSCLHRRGGSTSHLAGHQMLCRDRCHCRDLLRPGRRCSHRLHSGTWS